MKNLIEKIQKQYISLQMKKNEKGQAIVGYVLITAFIAVAAITQLPDLRDAIETTFSKLTSAISGNLQ